MRIFVAGASGAIGRPLIAELVRRGHEVTGMTRSESGARDLAEMGAAAARVSAFDAAAVERALRDARAEVVIDELTSLPKDPSEMAAAAPGDRKLRLEGGGNLHRAARACGVRRYIQQSSGFFLEPGGGLADESAGLAVDASPRVAASAGLCGARGAGAERGGDGRRRPAVRVLLRAGHLVPPGRGVPPIRSAGRSSPSSVMAGASGRGSTSRTRRSPPPTPSRHPPACTTSSMTTRRPSPSGCRRSPDSSVPRPRLGSPRSRRGPRPGRTPSITARGSAAPRTGRRRRRSASSPVAWNGWVGEVRVLPDRGMSGISVGAYRQDAGFWEAGDPT